MLATARAEQAESFTLTLSSAVPASELQRWFDGAPAGHRAVYASGLVLLQHADGVRLARRLANADRARLHEERDAANPRKRVWSIEKLAGAAREAARTVDRGVLARLLNLLRDCAEGGRACPSNADLARRLGLPLGERGRMRAKYLLARLAHERRIAVENRGTLQPRVVTIVAAGRGCGRSTAK